MNSESKDVSKQSGVKGISQHKCHPSALHCANNCTSANTQISEDENAGEHDDHDHSDSESVATTSCITSKSGSKYCSMIIPIHVHHESCLKKEVLIHCMTDSIKSDSSLIRRDIMQTLYISG